MSEAGSARIGLLGRGTVGGAFHELVDERAGAVEAASGRRPEIAGVLRRSEGDFDEILAGSDLIVELIGGLEPAREHVLAALARRQAGGDREQAAGRAAWRRALRGGPRGRRPAPLRGRGRRRGAGDPASSRRGSGRSRSSGSRGSSTGRPTSSSARWPPTGASYEDVLARAQELGYAEADPTEDVDGADAAAKMAILARLGFHTPVDLDDVSYEGITEISPDDIAYARELGLSLKLLGVAERHGERHQRARLSLLPLSRPSARARSRAPSTRSRSRVLRSPRSPSPAPAPAGSRPPPRCSPTSSRSSPGEAPVHTPGPPARDRCASSTRPSTSTSRSPTGPACWRRSPTCSAATGSRSRASSSAAPARTRGS